MKKLTWECKKKCIFQKKKVKRQRIESSESEVEPGKSPQKSSETATVKAEKESPLKSPVSEEQSLAESPVKTEIKLQKNGSVKTYSSPKSKKTKKDLKTGKNQCGPNITKPGSCWDVE